MNPGDIVYLENQPGRLLHNSEVEANRAVPIEYEVCTIGDLVRNGVQVEILQPDGSALKVIDRRGT